nr:autotransporter domain-containing protein [Pseudoxanthomonas yeongjuensis]
MDGAGSELFAEGDIAVGHASYSKGTLVLQDGGQARSGSGTVGANWNAVGEATVTGVDSSWSISHQLRVGNLGVGTLLVEAGGSIVSESGVLGIIALGEATVTGTGSSWINSEDLLVGDTGGGRLFVEAGGTVGNQSAFIGNEAGSGGEVTVTGVDSTWTSSGNLAVGNAGTGTLLVEAGGMVGNQHAFIGSETGSVGKATVTGAGSTWTNDGGLHVGVAGAGTLEILDGGVVSSLESVVSNGGDGTVLVDGEGSQWNAGESLVIGNFGLGQVTLGNGGVVTSTYGIVGNQGDAQSTMLVQGAGSAWTGLEDLYVGFAGIGALSIEDGGRVENGSGSIGSSHGSVGEVTVAGPGSSWINAGGLNVGQEGNGTLTIEAGGLVESAETGIGTGAGSTGSVTVTGAGSRWTFVDNGRVRIGYFGHGMLSILGGAEVSGDVAVIGDSTGSTGAVTVDGAGSTWTQKKLHVGNAGTGSLEILGGGRMESGEGYIGSGGSGEVKVSGIDSDWTNSGPISVGFAGTGVLLVEAGGTVSSASARIANHAGATGSKATVTGNGSAWINDGDLFVGYDGAGALEILDGGVSSSARGYIGVRSENHSTVRVQGTDSAWIDLEDLYIGSFIEEPGNGALTIDDGGRVEVHAGGKDFDVLLANIVGSTGTLNIGAGGAAGVLDSASVTGGAGTATLNFNHDDADYAFTNDGTAGGTAVLIGGTTTVNQIGTGTTVLTGAHTYTGATNVNAGTLLVEGSLGKTATTVADGGRLGGSGAIAGAVTIADGGILAPGSSAGTLTVGSLTLEEGATLDYELGRAGVIGDGVNDLVEVTGNLTLDGTLDITDIGGFGAGVYRLMNYGGDLTDKGLGIGDVPDGGDPQDLFVQTAIGGQVNLVNSAGLTLSFWDGSVASEHNNDAIDDGDGMWNAGNDNWTASDGTLNGRWHDGTFAVFGGTAGNVEVVGEQAIAGLQFMSGYTLTAGTDGALRIDGADSVIRVDPDVTATIDVAITGAGGLVKTDTGTLVLSGANSYEGGTRIDLGTLSVASDTNLGDAAGGIAFDGGTLQTTAAFASARDMDLQAGGGTFLTDADLGLGGVVSGAGTLTKNGDGTLTLTGANTYTGGTRVLDGTLVGDTGSIRGDLANNGTVVFDQADDATFAGKIAGSGTMTKEGVGVLTLTGNSALDWSIDAGALVAQAKQFGGDASIADGARLRFTEATGTYAGTLSGAGAFEIAGGNTVFALTGNSAAFTGTTSLESGTLQLGGTLGGNTRIANGAVLGGIGTLGSVDNHGTIAPGNSIGTLTLTGDYLHHDDATLLAEIEQGGTSDLLDIAGSATIEGGTVEVTKAPGQYEGGTRYTLIDAAGGVTGTFGTLDQDLPFLDLLLGYDANHVYLDVQRNEVDFNIVCGDGTFNQCQVAGALDRIADGEASADMKAALAAVTTLDLPGAQAAFDTLSGEAHGSLTGILLEGHALYGQAVSRRIADRRDETGAGRLQGGAWVRAYGASSDLEGDGNAHAADFEQRGLAVGFDAWGDEHWLIGASFNAMSIDADFRPGDRGEADTKNASLYTSFQGEHAYLDAVTSFAWWNNGITRAIVVGDIERQARSEYGGHRFATHLEAGWNFALGQRQQLTPLVSVEYAKLDQEGFREEGAQDLGLIGRSQDVERTTVSAGLRWTTAFERGDWTFEPTLQARWLHAVGDEYAEQDVAFAGAPDIGYRVRGVSWPQDRGLLGVGLQMRHGDNLDLFVDVDYQQGGGLEAKNLGAGVRWRW